MGSIGPMSAAAKQAEKLRIDGNSYFAKSRFGVAIDAYTEAITLCPNVAVYWTNRALCHRKRNDWVKVEEDCRRAIQLDSNSFKAHYMLGLALLEKGELTQGAKELQKGCRFEGLYGGRDMARTSQSQIQAMGARFYKVVT